MADNNFERQNRAFCRP